MEVGRRTSNRSVYSGTGSRPVHTEICGIPGDVRPQVEQCASRQRCWRICGEGNPGDVGYDNDVRGDGFAVVRRGERIDGDLACRRNTGRSSVTCILAGAGVTGIEGPAVETIAGGDPVDACICDIVRDDGRDLARSADIHEGRWGLLESYQDVRCLRGYERRMV